MTYFMGEFAQNQQKQDSELKRWGKVAGIGALVGAPLGVAYGTLGTHLVNKHGGENLKIKGVERLGLISANAARSAKNTALLGLGGYGIYRGGKYLVNKLKNRKNKKSNFSTRLNLVNFAKKEKQKPVEKEPTSYRRSMLGWTRNGAIAGAGTGALLGAPLGVVGSGIGALNGGLAGVWGGANLGAYRNAVRNINKNYKDPEQKKRLRYARRGAVIGTLVGNPGVGSVIGASMVEGKRNKSNYSLNGDLVVNFAQQKEKKRDSFNKLGVIGASGLGGAIGAGTGGTLAALSVGNTLIKKHGVDMDYEKVFNAMPEKVKKGLLNRYKLGIGLGTVGGAGLAGYGAYRLSKYLRNRKREV